MTVEDRLAELEAAQAELAAKDAVWRLATRYARAIDENDETDLNAIFTEDATLETHPWVGKVQEGRDRVVRAFKNYIENFDYPRRFITNEQFDVINDDKATGWANWFVVQAKGGESYYGWGFYEWDFRREDGEWRISRMLINIECMTTLEEGWGNLEGRVAAYPRD